MYKQQYYKYKQKYFGIKYGGQMISDDDDATVSPTIELPANVDISQIEDTPITIEIADQTEIYDQNDPDVVDYYDDPDLHPIEEEIPTGVSLDDIENNVKEMISDETTPVFEGFNEMLLDDLQPIQVDVGLYGLARAKVYDEDYFNESIFVKFNEGSQKTKILMINNVDDFDNFTEKYAIISDIDKNTLFIKWDNVAKDYLGFYLLSGATDERDAEVPYKDTTYHTWLDYDFTFLDQVLIFVPVRDLISYVEVDTPFKAKITEPFAVNPNEFVGISDKITYTKILVINDTVSFDKFTNKYGLLINNKNTDKKHIVINWDKVNRDYDGIYIDDSFGFKKDRYVISFYNGTKYRSWWKNSGIKDGLVYIFS